MIGLVIVTHGDFSKGLADSVKMITGEYENMVTLSLKKNDNAEELYEKILKSIEKADEGDGVMIFTDVLGGTPSNLSTLAARKKGLYCLTGVNLPMLIEFVMLAGEDLSLEQVAERCLEASCSGVLMTNKIG